MSCWDAGRLRVSLARRRLLWLSFGLALTLLHPNFWISEKPYENQRPGFACKMRFWFLMNHGKKRSVLVQSFEAFTKFHAVY